MTPMELVLSRFPDAKPHGDRWQAQCPAHDDKQASLSLREGDKGAVLHCFAGCSTESIVAAIGLTLADLFPAKDKPVRSVATEKKRIVATYPYTDATGNLLYEAVRYSPKDFRQRRPNGQGGYHWNLTGIKRVLYLLHSLHPAVQAGQTVYIVEGEKDADNLAALGLCATTNAGGAAKWDAAFSETLAGSNVVILPDNDVPGRDHAERVAKDLQGKAASVKVLMLPNLPPKGDVSDWLKMGGSVDTLTAFVNAAPEWKATQKPVESPPEGGKQQEGQSSPSPLPVDTSTVYQATERGMVWNRRTADGISPVLLSNFTARITQDTVEEDGAETRRRFTIEATLHGQTTTFDCTASEFSGMEWPLDKLGSRASLAPGRGTKDTLRAAIQAVSEATEQRVRTHTGWVQLPGGEWRYCHGESSGVSLSGALADFALPPPPTGGTLKAAIRAVLSLWQLGRPEACFPALCCPFRAVLDSCDFSLFIAGPTGVFQKPTRRPCLSTLRSGHGQPPPAV